jgi:hypothetical protein
MSIEQRRLIFLSLSFFTALVAGVSMAVLAGPVLAGAAFGSVCLVSFLLFSNHFKVPLRKDVSHKLPIILGVIVGLVLQMGGVLTYTGDSTVILFSGCGALLSMLASAVSSTGSELFGLRPKL